MPAFPDIAFVNTYPVGAGPIALVYEPGTNTIWAVNQTSNNVTKLNAGTGATIGTYAVGTNPQCICIDSLGNVWVTNFGDGTVTKILASTGATVGTYPTGTGPTGVCFDGTNIWVANSGDGTLTELTAATGAAAAGSPFTTGAGSKPSYIVFDGTNLWTTDAVNNTLIQSLASTGALLNTYPLAGNPGPICFDTVNLWVCCPFNATLAQVSPVSPTTGAVLQTIAAANLSTVFYAGYIWVASGVSFSSPLAGLSMLDPTGKVMGTYTAPYTFVAGLAFDGVFVWAAQTNQNLVTNDMPPCICPPTAANVAY